ncbi:MAG: ABC transporter substrate-binding protein [Lautropia sp.]
MPTARPNQPIQAILRSLTAGLAAVAFSVAMLTPATAMAARTDLTLGMQLEPPHLDPTAGAAAAIDEVVYANVFEGLTRFSADGTIKPALAKSWEVSGDGLTYTFKLQQGVKFHDGSPMSADDVKFSLDRARAEKSTNAQKALFAGIDSVEVVDPATVKVRLKASNGGFLFNMAWGDAVIVSPKSIDDAKKKPVGTGPFRFSNWVQGDRVEIVRNKDYWGTPAKLDKVTFKFISDPTAAFAALMAGDVQAFPVFPAPENLAQLKNDKRFKVIVGSTEGETILATNNRRKPFDDVRVREAISHAIDRKAIIDGAMFGYGTPIGTHFAPHHPAYADLTAKSAYDPARAKALLKEAGLADGFTTTLKLPPPPYARRGGEIIAAQLRAVGIKAEITNLEWAQWLEQVLKGKDYDLSIVSHTEPMDIGIYANPNYYFQYDGKEVQAMAKELTTVNDDARRNEILKRMQTKIADDYVNGFLFQLAKTGVADAKIDGLWENMPTQANDMTAVSWKD